MKDNLDNNVSKHRKKVTGPTYWRSLDEATESPDFKEWLHREFPAGASEIEGVNRRQFLKIMAAGFGLAGFGLAGCRQPERKILAYSKQPERVIQGVATHYSTSMPSAEGNIPLIVETHQARPTKVEGNPSYDNYGGGTDAYAQASILDLYDPDRTEYSTKTGRVPVSQEAVITLLKEIHESFKQAKGQGLALLTEKSTSPSRNRLLAELRALFPEMLWVEYEPVNSDKVLKGLSMATGENIKPVYHFDKAKRVLALDSDFLHSGPHHMAYARDFAKARKVLNSEEAHKMNRLYAAESQFTLTGGMADHRLRIASSHVAGLAALITAELYSIAGDAGKAALYKQKGRGVEVDQKWVKACAQDLMDHRGSSVVIAGEHQPEEVHAMAAAMNAVLNSQGKTLSYIAAEPTGSQKFKALASAIESGSVKSLIIMGGNPAYNAPAEYDFEKLVGQVEQVVRYGYYHDETSELAQYHVAASHYLESWSDGRTYDGSYVSVQPMIEPIYETVSELDFLLKLADQSGDAYDYVKSTHATVAGGSFDQWLGMGIQERSESRALNVSVKGDAGLKGNTTAFQFKQLSKDNLEVVIVPHGQLFDGRYNNNGWLQECPDPMTKLTWDNAILVSPRLAQELQDKTGIQLIPSLSTMNHIGMAAAPDNTYKSGKEISQVVELTHNGRTIKGPLHILPGLANYTLVAQLGYGREASGRVGEHTGFNSYPFHTDQDQGILTGVELKFTGETYKLANTQEHWSMEGRAIIREANVEDYQETPNFAYKMSIESHAPPNYGSKKEAPLQEKVTTQPRGGSAYETPQFNGVHQWGMSVDLNTCTGCNACVVACQSENNIPIVGKDQVLRGREMHWIRLDRYFSSASGDMTKIPEDPQVSFMGMMCQHCEMAPCEQVCPVNATVHDEEGLNTMAYNRCVGTRYCANNCPYKVRRFNFFDWNKRHIGHFYEGPLGPSGKPELTHMQKNPDVSIRMRGVMEKCTYCVQRIEEAKINQRVRAADSSDIEVRDGAIQVACQQVCPTDSIVFGDLKDPNSQVSQAKDSDRDYSVLGYLNIRPRTTYLAKLRNPNPKMPDYKNQPLSRAEFESRYGHGGGHHDDAPMSLAH